MNFTPAIYEYAARLIGVSPWQASRDCELLVQGHATAYRRYHHSPIVVGIDIYNLEAEAYGATIAEPDGNCIPSIATYPCATVAEIVNLVPLDPATAGRVPMVIEAGRKLKALFPEADIKVPVSGPFSLASNLVGFDHLLMDCVMAPGDVAAALDHLVAGQISFANAIHHAGLGITTFESAATPPLISPDMFRDIVLPVLKQFLDAIANVTGKNIPCIIGGDTSPILEYLMETHPSYVICPSETDQAEFMRKMTLWPEVMVRVNMDPGVMTGRDANAIRRQVDCVRALASDRANACLGSGVLPYEAEPEAVEIVQEYLTQARK
jgi:uroporphyrinogen decarboxylase